MVAVFAVGLTRSFFSDTETSSGNIFTSGSLDLKIDNESYYNGVLNDSTTWLPDDLENHKFFNFLDLKPSDWGEDTISLRVDTNDAWLCVDINLTSDDDNDCTEPELLDDPECTVNEDLFDGEVGANTNMVFWVDDGDNVLETDEVENIFSQGTALEVLTDASWALAHSNQAGRILLDSDLNESGAAIGGKTYWIGKYWCFGNLEQSPVDSGDDNNPTIDPGFTCDGSGLNNAPQSDSLLADISFRAEQARNNPEFTCDDCERGLGWADSVVDYFQGTLKNGSPITNPDRTDPNEALGPNDWIPNTATNFFSIGRGGNITLEFANDVINEPGDDLSFHEATNGRSGYPEERVEVYVSADNNTFYKFGKYLVYY